MGRRRRRGVVEDEGMSVVALHAMLADVIARGGGQRDVTVNIPESYVHPDCPRCESLGTSREPVVDVKWVDRFVVLET